MRAPTAESSRTNVWMRCGEKRAMRNPTHKRAMMPAPPRQKARAQRSAPKSLLSQDGSQVRNQAVLAECRKHDDAGKIQKGPLRSAAATVTPPADKSSSWTATVSGRLRTNSAVRATPAERRRPATHRRYATMMRDRPLDQRRDENRAHSADGENERECESSSLMKPREYGARVRKLRRSVGDESQHKKCEIELPDVWSESAERSEGQGEDQDRWQDDTSGWKAIKQKPNAGGNQSDSNCRKGEGATDRFTLPAKRCMQRIQEEAEGVRHDGSKATITPANAAATTAQPAYEGNSRSLLGECLFRSLSGRILQRVVEYPML